MCCYYLSQYKWVNVIITAGINGFSEDPWPEINKYFLLLYQINTLSKQLQTQLILGTTLNNYSF